MLLQAAVISALFIEVLGWGNGGGGWGTTVGSGGGGDGGWFPTMNPGGGGMSTPGWGGGGGVTGGISTPGWGGGGSMGTPGWGGGGGWGTTVAPTQDPTCEGNGGKCVPNDGMSCDGDLGEYVCEGDVVCCLSNVLPSSCGQTFILSRRRRGLGMRGISRIVDGSETFPHSWPWQVSLQLDSNFHFCGGSIISDQWVITAAHCVVGESRVAQVVMGEHDRSAESGREIVTSATVFTHPGYSNDAPYPNDIALLKLDSPVTFSEHVYPACLPTPGTVFDTSAGDECWISGWGDTKDSGDENTLNELRIEITDNELCLSKWGHGYILDTNICVGNGLIGACQGDSGGPLSCRRQGEQNWELAGATSWGASGCRTEDLPNVYTRVSEYRDWILTTIRRNL